MHTTKGFVFTAGLETSRGCDPGCVVYEVLRSIWVATSLSAVFSTIASNYFVSYEVHLVIRL